MKPTGEALKLKPTRVALWDRYGGSMDSGWIRWILEQAYPTTFEVVYAPDARRGRPEREVRRHHLPERQHPGPGRPGAAAEAVVAAQADRAEPQPTSRRSSARCRARITADKTIPQLKKFVENGGTLIAIGSGTSIAGHFGLPLGNHLSERQPNGTERRLGSEKFYVPGSVLQVAVDATNPLAFGVGDKVDVFFDNSPVFRLEPDAAIKGVKAVAWFDSPTPLRSGWAWGQQYLDGGAAMVEASVGKGKVFLFGPEVMFRGQPHGTFKFVFNGDLLRDGDAGEPGKSDQEVGGKAASGPARQRHTFGPGSGRALPCLSRFWPPSGFPPSAWPPFRPPPQSDDQFRAALPPPTVSGTTSDPIEHAVVTNIDRSAHIGPAQRWTRNGRTPSRPPITPPPAKPAATRATLPRRTTRLPVSPIAPNARPDVAIA